jgi:hypothetical protein
MKRSTTLRGWVPRIGELVWQTMYSPQRPAPDSTITERIEHGRVYMARRLQVVVAVVPDYEGSGLTRWVTRKPGPNQGAAHHSHTESDWCVLESVTAAEATETARNTRPDTPDMLPLFAVGAAGGAMTPEEAAWVRKHVATEPHWGHTMRKGTCDSPPGPCVPCSDVIVPRRHEDCEHGKPLPEAYLQLRRGPGYGTSKTWAPVWLADRVCRRICSCDCRRDPWERSETGPDGAEQPSLFAGVA